MAAVTPTADANAILRAPDLDSAERAYLGLLPDMDHVDALTRRALGLSRAADAARGVLPALRFRTRGRGPHADPTHKRTHSSLERKAQAARNW